MNRREFLVISITVFLTLICWIAADIYHEFLSGRGPKDIPPAPKIKDYSLPTFRKTLDTLKLKQE